MQNSIMVSDYLDFEIQITRRANNETLVVSYPEIRYLYLV